MAESCASGAVFATVAVFALTSCSVFADWSHLSSGGAGGGAGHAAGGQGGTDAGGGGANAGGNGAGGKSRCTGKKGAKEIDVGAFCIDATETSNAEYKAFIDDVGGAANALQPSSLCSWNDSYKPMSWPPPSSEDDQPVGNVNWCDAYAYCAWAGKRLCGKIGGGENAQNDFNLVTKSEWYFACTRGEPSTHRYPYGETYVPGNCNGKDMSSEFLFDVGSEPSCEGGFTGLFDMSGNVTEWDNSCDRSGATRDLDNCLARGGDSNDAYFALACGQSSLMGATNIPRSMVSPLKGIRCCSD